MLALLKTGYVVAHFYYVLSMCIMHDILKTSGVKLFCRGFRRERKTGITKRHQVLLSRMTTPSDHMYTAHTESNNASTVK